MRVLPVAVALATVVAFQRPALAETKVLQAPPGDTVLGIVQAPLVALRDTTFQEGAATAMARAGTEFQVLLTQDGWLQVVYKGRKLWTPQNGVRVTTAKIYRAERAGIEDTHRRWSTIAASVGISLVALLVILGIIVGRRRFQEVRRRWILLATRHEVLEEIMVKAGWDVQKLPPNTRLAEFLPHVRPTVVIADQSAHRGDIASLAKNASVASTPILWLDATVIERAPDPARAFLPPGAKVSTILETVRTLAKVIPGPEQLSRHGEIEGRLGDGRLLELLHFLATAKRTGRVEVRIGSESAWMWFEDGQIRHALAGKLTGAQAMYRCLDLPKGTFSFSSGVTPPERSIRESTLTLLHEYARQSDENAKIPGH
ncbi:MAG: DUF4388 domain-containing protein [Fibrobacteria bacterium]|nr:DUF4388 domain-containing protein [Fibrobacteria bacterium]